ncbi:MAG: prolipoprotein diacylglyceryl transferase [Clostridia bacterium]|nr:prolipoprotein diacylglyceryl transferase [Clostridia bacterium]
MIGTYLFHIGSFGVPSMGVCVLVGAILAVFLSWLLRKKSALDWNGEVVDAIILAVLLGFVGMKILYWIVTPNVFKDAFQSGFFPGVLSLLTEGMVFYGGLIGGIVGIIIVALKKKKNFFEFGDLMAPCFCVAHAFGRIGCLLVGCCYGLAKGETSQFGLCTYDGACALRYADGTMRLPAPLMEAIFLLLLCGVLVLIYRKEKHVGTVTGSYLVLYAVWRFIMEIFRGDVEERGHLGPFFTSQWISILILIAGVVILVLSRRWKKEEPFKEFHEEELVVPEPDETGDEPDEADEAVEEEAAEAVAEEIADAVEETGGSDRE